MGEHWNSEAIARHLNDLMKMARNRICCNLEDKFMEMPRLRT